jgi:adenylosuccinate synthase
MTNRCVDIVIGLNAGSEAKGKLISYITPGYKALVRQGSVNASHQVVRGGNKYTFHMIPCGCLHNTDAALILGPAAQIGLERLKKEIEILKEQGCWLDSNGKTRLFIDSHATIIESIDRVAENGGRMPDCGELYTHPLDCDTHNKQLNGTCIGCSKLPKDSAWGGQSGLGSTTSGVGANLIRKICRGTKMALLPGQKFDADKFWKNLSANNTFITVTELLDKWYDYIEPVPVTYAKDIPELVPYLVDTVDMLNRMIDRNEPIMIEGTQGAVLSLHHGFPSKTTSRDTNAAIWCADSGISPLAVRDVYGVCRTFPIRVAGNSGPLGTELTWDEVAKFSESPTPLIEKTSATKRVRRVFLLDDKIFRKSLDLNRPTKLMLSFVDYLHYSDYGKTSWDSLTQKSRDWITTLESKMGVFFNYLSTGPSYESTIVRKSPGELAGYVQTRKS